MWVNVAQMPNGNHWPVIDSQMYDSAVDLTSNSWRAENYTAEETSAAKYAEIVGFIQHNLEEETIVDKNIFALTAGQHIYALGHNALVLQLNISGNSYTANWSFIDSNFHTYTVGSVSLGKINEGATRIYKWIPALFINPISEKAYFGVILFNHQKANYPFRATINTNIAYGSNWISPTTLYSELLLNVEPEPTPSTDPYADGGTSTGTTTGTGTFDDTSESVPLPTTYALSATASGIMSQYVLTEANLAAFGSWLWNGGTIVDDLKHFFQSPMEAIFSIGILPFTPSDTTQYNVYVGALAATGVKGGLVGDTVEKISCGSITFNGYYGGALDYNPYTKIELFLPYCGTLTLNADEVMGHTISVNYYCDTITGDCVAFVSDEERVLHQVRGNCFIQIPLAARDFTALYSSAISTIGTIAAGLATAASGGISAPVAVGLGTSMAANAMNAKTHIARAGGVSGMAGFMSIQKPYVIMTIPNQCLPEFQNDFQGYPLFVTKRLGDFSGYTKVYEIHLDGLDCTDAEAKEIYELLKGGVIL